MMLSALTAFGAPLLARLAIRRAEKHGLLPARHYLRRAIRLLQDERFADAHALLQLALRNGQPSLPALAAVDLALMRLDAAADSLAQQVHQQLNEIRHIESERAALSRQRVSRLRKWAMIWAPTLWKTVWLTGGIGGLIVSMQQAPHVPLFPVMMLVGLGLAMWGWHEAKQILYRRRVFRMHVAHAQRRERHLQYRLVQARAAWKQMMEKQKELQHWRHAFTELLESASPRARRPHSAQQAITTGH